MVFRDAAHRRAGDRIKKSLGNAESTLAGTRFFTKIEAYEGMAERLVRYLAIEEDLHDEIKDTIEHNTQSYVKWCALSDKGKKTRLNLPLHMMWAERRDHLVRDMTPLVSMPSSLVDEARG